MAQYDMMGNYTGYDDYSDPIGPAIPMGMETEEERRKREEEERKRREAEAKRADESVAREEKVITYENGSRTVETKQEIPAGFRMPTLTRGQSDADLTRMREAAEQASRDPSAAAMTARQAQRPNQPVAPVSPNYNANIARQESGNRPDIGFHDRNKSSAYGTYGMTTAGYEDARRRDPSLPADIRQATPEQQTQAQTAYTQQNAGYLQNLGIEPTENNLAAAHFLGAQGLSNY
jgi:hypothetical protein